MCVQQHIKKDPQGYKDEFQLQWRHYEATRGLFLMSPGQPSLEFQSLVMFMAHVSEHYPDVTQNSFQQGIVDLLEKHGPLLEHSTRLTLVKALILMRNKNSMKSVELLPILFSLFPIHDKSMRQLMSRHIAADIKGANKKGKNEQFNRRIQNILLPIIEQEDEVCAKRALSLMTDMWRRQIWRDTKTANGIASAAFHPSPRVMVASLKFFLGQDVATGDDGSSDDEDEDDDSKPVLAQPTKEEVYKAFHKGTTSSKKKKQKKLKRAMHSVKKALRQEEGQQKETFAAIQLLHDPQGFAEKLFSLLRSGNSVKGDTRMLMMSVVSRVIGVHQLVLINFYPLIQKYITPSRQDITSVLAALVQACHSQVPPDALAPVLRQLVDQFIHDRARPEVITVGIKTVREICLRAPLVMTPELLQELVEYKKYRDKEVATVARSLLGLFRELAPDMLKKKDRGRMGGPSTIQQYGVSSTMDRIDGVELLEEALQTGRMEEDDDGGYHLVSSSSDQSDTGEEEGEEEEAVEDVDTIENEEEEEVEEEVEVEEEERRRDQEDPEAEEDQEDPEEDGKAKVSNNPESLTSLRKKLAMAKKSSDIPLEHSRILTQEDFQNIKALKHKKLVEQAMKKHGLKSASKRAAAREIAEQEAEDQLNLESKRSKLHEHAVNPMDLLGKKRGRADKEERLASVMEGREGREFGAKSRIKKAKTGGLSNREKQKRKNLPMGAVGGQVRKRLERNKLKSAKNFKGHVRH